ncbi:YlxM family DNA-binding protein [Bacilliculturomica massiliensis]|uniref:YlxM family DNA-binding protein n=1 Tax=Bacilliculturomica massiliensis TaxID=1917867 RepID=UPI0010314B3A|nr:YlxM family DNA-binding protein [Bacilliculturomica massiliensis]
MVDKIAEISMLYDFYGQLLPQKQKAFFQLYHEENYSLSEIAEEFEISRQGVHDGVKKAEKTLFDLEEKLGLVKKFTETAAALKKIDGIIDGLIEEYREDPALTERLAEVRRTIDRLGD